MKKYQNISNKLVCVTFKDGAQFLYKGQFIETDKTPIKISKGIQVTDVVVPVVEKAPKPKTTRKKTAKKSS